MNPSSYPAPFQSAHVRARIVKILLIAGAVAAGLLLLAEAISLAFPPPTEDQELVDNLTGTAMALLVFLLAVLDMLIYWTTAVFFCVWLYRAYGNLRAFNSWSRPDYSPGWAVGGFFIPFVNLVLPYRAVREVWQKSVPPDPLVPASDPPASFPLWWTFWLVAGFASKISFRVSFREEVPESTATMISIVAGALTIVAAVFAYLVVDAIDKRQEETSARVKLGAFPGPPPPPPNLGGYQDPAAIERLS
jgi:hypothetical protein